MDFARYTSALRLNVPLIRVSSDILCDFPGHDLLSPNPEKVFPSAEHYLPNSDDCSAVLNTVKGPRQYHR